MSTEEAAQVPPTRKKVSNSYYYWHGHEKERAAVGDVAPMPTPVLVKTDAEDAAVAARALALRAAATVKKYSWSDGSKFVTVYIATSDPGATTTGKKDEEEEVLVEDSVQVEYTKVSLTVSFQTSAAPEKPRRMKQLQLHLSKRIDPARCEVKLRPEKKEIHVKLAKEEGAAEPWFELVGNAKEEEGEEGAEGDEALE